jgi:AhpC/TSA family
MDKGQISNRAKISRSEPSGAWTKGKTECKYAMGNVVELRATIKKNVICSFFFGIVAVLLPFSSIALSGNPLSAAGFMDFKEKKAAPDFILNDLEDNPIRLDAFKGKVVLLYFWTTW